MRKLSIEEFIRRSHEIHAGKYDYSSIEVIAGQDMVLTIGCPEHGYFTKSARLHLRGVGCPQCSKASRGKKMSEIRQGQENLDRRKYWNRKEFSAFIDKAKNRHENYYDYSQVDYQGCQTPVKIICPVHGVFTQKPVLHLQGKGCQRCRIDDRRLSINTFIEHSRKVHGYKYDYSLITEYKNNQSRLTIVCPEHGEFKQVAHAHLRGVGCPFCGNIKKGLSQRFTTEDFVSRAMKLHNGKYDYSRVCYITAMIPVEMICPVHGSFTQMPYQHLTGEGCPRCVHRVSDGENEIGDWLILRGFRVERNVRGIISNRSELDIYLPDQKLAIEYNGVYWHSSRTHRGQTRHLDKLRLCESKGIRLIQLWDIEWEQKKAICKEIILFALGLIDRRIYARNCILREIDSKESNEFLIENHIQGSCMASYRIGLFYLDELVGVQCYAAPNMGGTSRKDWLIVRTCFTKGTQVIGGISKMFSQFVRNIRPERVIDYTDRRLFVASGHSKMGFVHDKNTNPCSQLTNGHVLYSRRYYRHWGNRHFKFKMPWDENLSDTENLANNGWYWVWDCGKIKNVWKRLVP